MTDLERRLAHPTTPTIDPSRLTAELARRADVEGLLDVAWATLDTPLGPIAVFVTPRGVVRVAYDRENFGQVADEVAEHVSPRVLMAPRRTDPVREQLLGRGQLIGECIARGLAACSLDRDLHLAQILEPRLGGFALALGAGRE